MKYILLLVATLILSMPLRAQTQLPQYSGIVFGDDTLGFTIDTLSVPKVTLTRPWYWEVTPLPLVNWYFYDIAACLHLHHKNGWVKLRWFVVNQESFGFGFWGYALPVGGGQFWIFLAITRADSKELVQHEMVHALLFWNQGILGHPPEYFSQCGLKAIG